MGITYQPLAPSPLCPPPSRHHGGVEQLSTDVSTCFTWIRTVFFLLFPQALGPTVNYSHFFFFFFLNLADILNAVRRLTDRSYIIRVTETQKSNRNGMERRANVPKESNANWSWVTARGGWTHTLIFALWTAKRLLTLIWEKAQRKIRLEYIFQNKLHTRYALQIDTSCMD